jgi:alkylation response protein AidB-like acyl-CoA dehydrogenase
VVENVNDRAAGALSCQQIGGAAAALDTTVEYLTVRHRFGRPIESFQEIRHRCTDILVELASALGAGGLLQRYHHCGGSRLLSGRVDRKGPLLQGVLPCRGQEY